MKALRHEIMESPMTTEEAPPNAETPPCGAAASAAGSAIGAPRVPTLVIEGGKALRGFDFRDLWAHRDLLYFLAWRDVKVRYKQTAMGVAWVILQPLLTMAIFTVLFGRLAKVPSDGEPYPIFVFAGLLPWTYFNQAVTTASNSLVGNAALITKVYFPRLVIPAAAVCAGLVDFAISASIMFLMAFHYGMPFGASLLLIPPLMALTALFALCVGMWMSALNVKYRDVRYALPFLLQIWMYLTPIIYPLKFIPERWRWLLALNPLSGMIQAFRAAVFGRAIDWSGLGLACAMTAVFLIAAGWSFRRMERQFADIV